MTDPPPHPLVISAFYNANVLSSDAGVSRPLVLLLHYGAMHSYIQTHNKTPSVEWQDGRESFSPPRGFKTQRRLVEDRLKLMGGISGAAVLSMLVILILLFK